MRRPLMARLMTSCWICSVPSKMSMISVKHTLTWGNVPRRHVSDTYRCCSTPVDELRWWDRLAVFGGPGPSPHMTTTAEIEIEPAWGIRDVARYLDVAETTVRA